MTIQLFMNYSRLKILLCVTFWGIHVFSGLHLATFLFVEGCYLAYIWLKCLSIKISIPWIYEISILDPKLLMNSSQNLCLGKIISKQMDTNRVNYLIELVYSNGFQYTFYIVYRCHPHLVYIIKYLFQIQISTTQFEMEYPTKAMSKCYFL